MNPLVFTTSLSLDKLSKGDSDSLLARNDFFLSLNDPDWVVTYPSSIKILRDLCLINEDNKVHPATRNAFREAKAAKKC